MVLKNAFFPIWNDYIQKDNEIHHQYHFSHKDYIFFPLKECFPSGQFQLGAYGYLIGT